MRVWEEQGGSIPRRPTYWGTWAGVGSVIGCQRRICRALPGPFGAHLDLIFFRSYLSPLPGNRLVSQLQYGFTLSLNFLSRVSHLNPAFLPKWEKRPRIWAAVVPTVCSAFCAEPRAILCPSSAYKTASSTWMAPLPLQGQRYMVPSTPEFF